MVRRNAIYPMSAGFDVTETVVERIRTAFVSTNLFFSVKYKPLPTGSSETESELWLGFWTASQNSCVRTDWIPTNVGQWLNQERINQCVQERIKQHVPKAIRQKTTLTQEQGTHRSQPTRTQPNRKCKAKSKTQFEPESDSAIGQHLLESNQCACNYSDSQFKILTTARSQFHLSLLEAVYISRKKTDLCRQKQFVFTLQLFR